ncbi:MAG: hypothetical protein KIH89_002780 [Candidatus Shapirobacteria bacterium]|nr:hypothetical protein [Candidatus Shapirobacteria bacterium]
MEDKKGQSVVEIIFSIGVITIVIVGIVSLVVNVINTKTNSLKRKSASEMGNILVENWIKEKTLRPDYFWGLVESESRLSGSSPEFAGYTYEVGFTAVVNGSIGCHNSPKDCANVIINIFWDSGEGNLSITRFFSKKS